MPQPDITSLEAAPLAAEPDQARCPVRRKRGPLPVGILVPGGLLLALLAAYFLGPALFHLPAPNKQDLFHALRGPGTKGHLLGTDSLGRDTLARALAGGRTSLFIAASATALGMLLGGSLGLIAGFKAGIVDTVISRLIDVALAFPALILALVVVTFLGANVRDVIIAVAVYTVPAYMRLTRASTIAVRDRGFVVAARQSGAPNRYLLRRHVIPQVVPTVLAFALIAVGTAVAIESSLSFLGLGVQAPTASWGNMIAQGQPYLTSDAAIVLTPGAMLLVTIVLLNILGDGIRDSLDRRAEGTL